MDEMTKLQPDRQNLPVLQKFTAKNGQWIICI